MRDRLWRIATSPYLVMIVSAAVFGGTAVAGRAAADEVLPFQLSFWRWISASLILIPLGYKNVIANRAIVLSSWRMIALLGVLSSSMFSVFVFAALQLTTAINVLLISATMPAFILFLAWMINGSSVSRAQIAGIILALAGTIVIVLRGDLAMLATLRLNWGDILVFGSILSWALYSVLLPRVPRGLSQFGFMALVSISGVLSLIPFFIIEIIFFERMTVSVESIGQIFYVGVVSAVIAYTMFNYGVAKIGPDRAGPFLYLPPLFGAAGAMLLLGEAPHYFHLAGAGLIFFGIYLATSRKTVPRGS